MDPSVSNIEKYVFNLNDDCKEFYGDVVEEDPHQIPEPLVRPVYIGCFFDTENVGNTTTRRSYSGIMLCVKNALIKSSSKRQTQFSQLHLAQS